MTERRGSDRYGVVGHVVQAASVAIILGAGALLWRTESQLVETNGLIRAHLRASTAHTQMLSTIHHRTPAMATCARCKATDSASSDAGAGWSITGRAEAGVKK